MIRIITIFIILKKNIKNIDLIVLLLGINRIIKISNS